jgi:predicted nucleotidyltransferase
MSQQELLKRIIQLLDARKIAYMVTGSVTSSLQGEPRSTHDIDFVIDVPADAPDSLLGAFPESEFSVSDQSIWDAVSGRTMFNVVDLQSADKVDFWLLTDEPFDGSRFARKQIVEVEGMRFPVSAP